MNNRTIEMWEKEDYMQLVFGYNPITNEIYHDLMVMPSGALFVMKIGESFLPGVMKGEIMHMDKKHAAKSLNLVLIAFTEMEGEAEFFTNSEN